MENIKRSVVFFIARFSHSGVPLAQIRLAKAMVNRGFSVEVIFGYVPENVKLPVNPGISYVDLKQPRTIKLLLPIVSYIKLKNPDIIFTAEDHLNAVVTLAAIISRSKAKISASSRVTPYDTYSNNIFSKKWILKIVNQLLWKRVDALTCVSKDMVNQYKSIFGKTKHQAVYNLIVNSDLDAKKAERVTHSWFCDTSIPIVISAGRLAPEKGFFDLISAMAIVNEKMHARLVILGDGPLKVDLQKSIEEFNLADKVLLLGFEANPYKFFSKSQVFVLSSYLEGLPNVLVEAMACGCTAVSTDCPTGPREVLKDGKFGALVALRSPQALADAIIAAIKTPQPHEVLMDAVFPFTEEEVLRVHQRVLGFS